jgi:type III secretion HrpO family protein
MLIYYINQALWLTLLVAGPVVLVTTVLGFVLGLIQSVFQLQDQALPFGIKIVAVTFVLVATGPWIAGLLIQFSESIFTLISSSALKQP